ncbi:MAG: M48 family metalloprotease [Chloroflexota bacterium]
MVVDHSSHSSPLSASQLQRLRCATDRRGIMALLAGLTLICALVPGALFLMSALAIVTIFGGGLWLASVRSLGAPLGPAIQPRWDQNSEWVTHQLQLDRRSLPILVLMDPQANAFAAWAVNGRLIAVTSGAAQLLAEDDAAQRYLLGHECGHVLFHQPWSTIVSLLVRSLGLFGSVTRLAWLFWERAAERTSDRVGLVLSGSPLAATRALVAMHSGTVVDDAQLGEAIRSLPVRPHGLWGYLAEAFASHPFMQPRLQAMYAFAASKEYEQFAGFEAAERARFELAALGINPERRAGPFWPRAVSAV